MTNNILLQSAFATVHESIPFDKIKNADYLPGIKTAIKLGKQDIENIVNNPEKASFENTIAALDHAGQQLDIISNVFFNLLSAESDDEMQKIAQELSPLITEFHNDIMLNEILFQRVKTIHDSKGSLNLKPEQLLLLEDTYRSFVRNGALLKNEEQNRYREISTQLGQLSLQFDENALKEMNKFSLHITDKSQLGGLPDFVLDAAEDEAKAQKLEGWVFTLHYPSYAPFMQYADNRELRRKMYMAQATQCSKNDEFDNQNIIKTIVKLRIELANLLNYKTYADYVLAERMAESVEKVTDFLNQLTEASVPKAQEEYKELQAYARQNGSTYDIMPWDWSYWSEKLRHERYNINDSLTKPYFQLENVETEIFALANTLYNIKFTPCKHVSVYHKDVKVYEVTDSDKDNAFLGLLYLDFFPRKSKQSGAWMTSFKPQYKDDKGNHRPHISMVCNFSKPTKNTPSLLTHRELTTFLHEFGHALHGLLSDVTYQSQSGTSVVRDFVELPSQFMENFGFEKAWLHKVAKHYKTGEAMPDEMMDKIIEAGKFHTGTASARQLGLGKTDMAWHSLTQAFTGNVVEFEQEITKATTVLPQIKGCATSPIFGHIFAGGYAAGYYGYKWAEVLDADAFASFKEEGIFNPQTAARFRNEILAVGSSRKEMESYKAFKGREPMILSKILIHETTIPNNKKDFKISRFYFRKNRRN